MRDEEQELIAKLRKIEQLFGRPGTDGERAAAESASNRIQSPASSAQTNGIGCRVSFFCRTLGPGHCLSRCCGDMGCDHIGTGGNVTLR